MIYEFEAPDGSIVEHSMPMADAPDFGDVVEIDGVPCRRVASAGVRARKTWTPYVSNRLPRNLPGFECTPQGKPIITTQAVERSAASKLGWERD